MSFRMPKIKGRDIFFHIGDIVDLLYKVFDNLGKGESSRSTIEYMLAKAIEAELKVRDLKEYLESLLVVSN